MLMNPNAALDILKETGIVSSSSKIKTPEKIREVFDNAGASIEDVAAEVAFTMKNGKSDESRLKASDMILKVHGIFKEMDQVRVPQVHIHIEGNDNQTLINLVCP